MGGLSDLVSSAYKFSRKQKHPEQHEITLEPSVPHVDQILKLVEAKNRAKEWANGRGDV